jgi:hypothetical protein
MDGLPEKGLTLIIHATNHTRAKLDPDLAEEFEKVLDQLRVHLDAKRFNELMQEGHAIDSENAILLTQQVLRMH